MSRRAAGEESRPVFIVEKPHFFNIIRHKTLKEKRLLIPGKFVQLHGHTLSKTVLLKLPTGEEWRIGLEKRDGMVWLGFGWPQFAKSQAIVEGHMLVFEYHGNSNFSLVIFNESTSYEVDYPLLHSHCHANQRRPDKEKGETSKRRRSEEGSVKKSEEGKFRAVKCNKEEIVERTKPLGPREVEKALSAASGFTSDRPFFKAVMQPSYVLRSRMSIPKKFAKEHLKQRSCKVRLELLGGRSWSLEYNSGVYNPNAKYSTARFFNGWKAFAQDNALDIGDVCAFVLTQNSHKKIAFVVTIFRNSTSQGRQGGGTGTKGKEHVANSHSDTSDSQDYVMVH